MFSTAYAGGATSKQVYVRGFTASTGLPYTAGTFETASIASRYRRAGAVAEATITLATQTISGAYSSGGFVHIAGGVYRLDVPNAALEAGADFVDIWVFGVTDVVFTTVHIDITGSDPRASTVTIADAGITAAKFAANAITATVIADNAITAPKIATDAIAAAKVAADAVTKIQAGLSTAAALTTVDNEIATLQTTADAILVDTGTSLPADIAALDVVVDRVEADTQDIQSRIPAALAGGKMVADATSLGGVPIGEGGMAPGSPIGEV